MSMSGGRPREQRLHTNGSDETYLDTGFQIPDTKINIPKITQAQGPPCHASLSGK
jgi:hypothetical protein